MQRQMDKKYCIGRVTTPMQYFLMALCQVLGWDSYDSRPVTIFKAFFTFLGSIFILGHDK